MAYDDGILETLRGDLGGRPALSEKRMFGGVCLMLNGNMLCGTSGDHIMYRVGKANESAALAVPGAAEMGFTGRRMGGFVELAGEAVADDAARTRLLSLALEFVGGLPAK